MKAEPVPVLCVCWDKSLAETRRLLLSTAGIQAACVLGPEEALQASARWKPQLLVLGHSVPRSEKQRIIQVFHRTSHPRVLSLLEPHQAKLPEADYGAFAATPADFVQAVTSALDKHP